VGMIYFGIEFLGGEKKEFSSPVEVQIYLKERSMTKTGRPQIGYNCTESNFPKLIDYLIKELEQLKRDGMKKFSLE